MLDLSHGSVLLAFGLTLFAGLATAIGAALAFFARRTGFGFLSVSLGFSAGVMLYVSFVEILPKAQATLAAISGDRAARWQAVGAFFAGVLVIGLIDRVIPKADNPHEPRAQADVDQLKQGPDRQARLMRTGLFAALAIGIHNFPEGLGTFLAALEDPKVGTAIAIAIALHNIPEGVSVAVPIFFATGKRRRAFTLSALSGLAEPAGALIGYALLLPILTPTVVGLLFGAVAGIMVYISLDELLPTAREYGSGHAVLYGLFSGMAVMALSLLLI